MTEHTRPWWQTAVIYQIYPRSFQDTTGDGIGDLPGISRRLDYLAETLGVDAIWISPFYPSPMADFGYDVVRLHATSTRCSARSTTSTRCWLRAHDRDLRVILDLVPNHTSDQHPWFRAPRSPRRPERDWYTLARPGAGRRRRPTTGSAVRRRLGVGVGRGHRSSTTSTPSSRSSPTSTGATPRCARPCSTSCASGSTAASTASASTSPIVMKDPAFRDNPPEQGQFPKKQPWL